MVHSNFGAHVLQLAMMVRDANGTDMIALRKKKFRGHAAIVFKFLGVCFYLLIVLSGSCACGKKLGRSFHFDQTQPAGADFTQAVQMT